EGIAAIDQGIALFQQIGQLDDRRMGDRAGRQHDPDRSRLFQLMHEIGEIAARCRALICKATHRIGALVVNDAAVSRAHQPPHDVAAHTAEADHAKLHCAVSVLPAVYCNASSTALARIFRPPSVFAGRCTRNSRRPRSARTSKSPRAWAALTTPKL